MVDSVGKQLQKARKAKGLTIDEVARDTRIRADRIADLENDTYTNFPSTAYARGFLTMYAKHVGVDVSQFAHTLDTSGSQVAVVSYEYLDRSEGAEPAVARSEVKSAVKPALIAVGLVVLGVAALFIFMLIQRLQQVAPAAAAATPAPEATTPRPVVRAAPTLRPEPTPAPVAAASPAVEDDDKPVRRAVAIDPNAAATPVVAGVEVVLTPKKRTYVKVQSDVEGKPLFADWLEADAEPMKLNGPRFWIYLKDGDAVDITKDGEPVTYEARGVWIQ